MSRVLVYSPSPLDGVSFYRQWGPLSQLIKSGEIQATSFSNDPKEITHWHWYKSYNVCLLSRPHRHHDLVFAEHCKDYGLPLWVDYDDALLEITPDNPVYDTFASDSARKIIETVLSMADVITVSSVVQLEHFKKRFKNVMLIENALDDDFLKFKKPFDLEEPKRIAWRGSDSHLLDLQFYGAPVVNAMLREREAHFRFFGMKPFFLTMRVPYQNWSYVPFSNQIQFVKNLTDFNAHIQIVPLIDTFFNRVKSDLAWIDATLAGSVVLGPNFEQWQDPSIFKYERNQPGSFEAQLKYLLNASDLEKYHNKAWENILNKRLLSKINQKRLELIKSF